jgi:hypothetical protein
MLSRFALDASKQACAAAQGRSAVHRPTSQPFGSGRGSGGGDGPAPTVPGLTWADVAGSKRKEAVLPLLYGGLSAGPAGPASGRGRAAAAPGTTGVEMGLQLNFDNFFGKNQEEQQPCPSYALPPTPQAGGDEQTPAPLPYRIPRSKEGALKRKVQSANGTALLREAAPIGDFHAKGAKPRPTPARAVGGAALWAASHFVSSGARPFDSSKPLVSGPGGEILIYFDIGDSPSPSPSERQGAALPPVSGCGGEILIYFYNTRLALPLAQREAGSRPPSGIWTQR